MSWIDDSIFENLLLINSMFGVSDIVWLFKIIASYYLKVVISQEIFQVMMKYRACPEA